jgi:hypothetical protein
VIVAWGSILPGLPVATRSAVSNAQPLRVDGDIVIFGVPPAVIEAARPRFKKEADTIRDALAQHLGRTVRFNLESTDQFSTGGGSSRAATAPEEAREAPPPTEDEMDIVDIDLSQTSDVPSGPAAPVALLQQQLGATVVEELPRDAGA